MKHKIRHKRQLIISGLLVLLVFSTFLYIPINASDDEEETDDDDDEKENARDLQIEVSDSEASIESRLKTGDIHNEFNVEMTTEDEGLEIQFEFEIDNDTVETEIEFEVTISEIVEYIDDPIDGFYNESIDEIVQALELDDFNPIVYTIETISNDTVHVFAVETTDGIFSAQIYFTGEFVLINDTLIAPTQLKIDIGIHNFNYSDPNSVLALKVELDSELEVEYEDNEETEDEEHERAFDEHEVEIAFGDYTGFFSWIETVNVDGVEYEVKATPIYSDDEENKLYLNYPRGNEIIHDPKIGIADILKIATTGFFTKPWIELPNMSRNELLIVSAITLVTIFGLVMIVKRKRT